MKSKTVAEIFGTMTDIQKFLAIFIIRSASGESEEFSNEDMKEIFGSMNEEQKQAVYAVAGMALLINTTEEEIQNGKIQDGVR